MGGHNEISCFRAAAGHSHRGQEGNVFPCYSLASSLFVSFHLLRKHERLAMAADGILSCADQYSEALPKYLLLMCSGVILVAKFGIEERFPPPRFRLAETSDSFFSLFSALGRIHLGICHLNHMPLQRPQALVELWSRPFSLCGSHFRYLKTEIFGKTEISEPDIRYLDEICGPVN